jgi:hypothetical protein
MGRPSSEELDDILALQLVIAWAGETPGGDHRRLGWWKTDVIDDDAGGDLWKRLLPRTKRWAGLDAARCAACLADAHARRQSQKSDSMFTLFHLGFEVDEALDERLAHHKLEAQPPPEVLPLLQVIAGRFDREKLTAELKPGSLDTTFKVVAGGRQLKKVADEALSARARRLSCALLAEPAATAYPAAFILDEGSSGKR